MLPSSPAADEVPTGLTDEVQRALGSLPDDFRVPVVLCDVSDLSYEQIAEATGVPIGTVRSAYRPGTAPAACRARRRRGDRAMSMQGDALDPDMLSAYLDGELTDEERVAVAAQLEASAEWRSELAEVRAGVTSCAVCPQRDAPTGFWDAVHASVVADDAPRRADREVVVPITVARFHAHCAGAGWPRRPRPWPRWSR